MKCKITLYKFYYCLLQSEKKENTYKNQLQELQSKLKSTESFLKDSEKSLAINIQAKEELDNILKDYKEHV